MGRSIVKNIIRRSEKNSRRGKLNQKTINNERLVAALEFGPIRPIESYLVFEITTNNPRTDIRHTIQICHEMDNGNSRYAVYLDGEKWRNQWSRTRFCAWLFNQIDNVVNFK